MNYRDAVVRTCEARWVLTSALDRETANDGAGEHSPFARGFLAALAQADADAQDVHTVLQSVKASLAESNVQQLPWAHRLSADKAEFLISPARR